MKQRLTLLFILLTIVASAQNQATEIRAVWLTTNWELDMPSSRYSEEKQRNELTLALDELLKMKINTVFFQTRVRGDVFYKSAIEPFSPHYKWSKNSDMLNFMIEECHKRCIEVHSWFVVYPLGSKKHVQKQKQSVANRRPDICKLYKGEWYLDPGNPETRTYLLSLVDEIITKYDVDGIHFDYVRYPDEPSKFPDKETFSKYGKGMNLGDWRRNNVTQFVEEAYNLVKNKKPWVLVSSSPIGKYKNLNEQKNEWTGYGSVFQDAGLWMEKGIHDAIFPMLYHQGLEFDRHAEQWLQHTNGRIFAPGIGLYRLDAKEGNWDVSEIGRQIQKSREQGAQGQAFYRMKNLTEDLQGVKKILTEEYKYPAKLPPLTWLSTKTPDSPTNLEVLEASNNSICIRWEAPINQQGRLTYTVYISDSDYFDVDKPGCAVATLLNRNEVFFKPKEYDEGMYYTVTASDRFHNESQIIESAFFIYSDIKK